MDPGAEERLGGVDVADADEGRGVHQKGLDRGPAPRGERGQVRSGDRRLERFPSEPEEVRIALELPGRGDEGEAEATRIAQAQFLAGVELERQVLVRLAAGFERRQRQAPAHAEMDDQGSTPLEVDEKVLAPPPKSLDPPTAQAAERPPVERLAQRRRVDAHPLDAPPRQPTLEAAPQDLDLGELRHPEILVARARGVGN